MTELYKGYEIYFDSYLGGYTVYFAGDDLFFVTVNEAKNFIDSIE